MVFIWLLLICLLAQLTKYSLACPSTTSSAGSPLLTYYYSNNSRPSYIGVINSTSPSPPSNTVVSSTPRRTQPPPTKPPTTTHPPQITCGANRYLKAGIGIGNNQGIGGRLIGGYNSAPNEFPWMALLDIYNRNTGKNEICGGSVIDDQWILTSAQCCIKANTMPKDITVKLGGNNINGFSLTTKCSRIIIHPSYNRDALYNDDFCLLEIEVQLKFADDRIQPICLPDTCADSCQPGDMVTISGWGATSFGGPTSENLQRANIPLQPTATCQQSYKAVTEKMICAGFIEGGVDSCTGDGGGPLQCSKQGFYTLDGVASFGKGCALPGFPGVYSRVCTALQWIESTIGYNSPPLQPAQSTSLPLYASQLTATTIDSVPPVVIFGSKHSTCGLGISNPNSGPVATPGEFPWQIFLHIYSRALQAYTYCGGVYIRGSWVLAPAHCCQQAFQLSDIVVDFGMAGSTPANSFSATAVNMILHPQFSPGNYDFCLIKAKIPSANQNSPNLVPICLPENCESTCQPTDLGVVVSWSSVQLGATQSAKPLKHYLPIYTTQVCQNGLGAMFGDNKVCTAPSQDACTGDQGSVLICNKRNSGYTIDGIAGAGNCASFTPPLLFHQVCKIRHWIEQIVRN